MQCAVPNDFVSIEGMHIHGCGSNGVGASFSEDLWITGNHIHDAAGGMTLSPIGDRTIVEGNHIHDTDSGAVYAESGQSDIDMGGDGIPDGVVISRNLVERTGAGGGAGLNLAGVRAAVIVNNLLLENLAAGIALFENMASPSTGCLVAQCLRRWVTPVAFE